MTEYLKIGSLFAGIGGLDIGLERARSITGKTQFQCAWQVENDDYATRVLAKHWPNVRRWGDVCTFLTDSDDINARRVLKERELQQCKEGSKRQSPVSSRKQPTEDCARRAEHDVDIIAAGWPCQDISFAGRGDGLDGERSGLFFEVVRVVRQLRPKYVLLENVAALLNRGLDRVLGELAAIGYDAEWHCIPAAAVGAPHIRDRVFIIAYTASHGRRQGEQDNVGCNPRSEQGTQYRPGMLCQDATDTQQMGRAAGRGIQRDQEQARKRRGEFATGSQDATVTSGPRLEEWNGTPRERPHATTTRGDWWSIEPSVRELVDGVSGRLVRYAGRTSRGTPNRVAKLRCLGNAVVPQVAQYVGEMILNHHEQTDLHNSPQTCDD